MELYTHFPKHYFILFLIKWGGRDSSVGIATWYVLDGPGIESRCGRDFHAPVLSGHGAHPASCAMGTGSFPGVKRPGCGADYPSNLSFEDIER
jgi:hypothetical protein